MNASKAETSGMLTPAEVAAVLGIRRHQAYRWIHRSDGLAIQRRSGRIFIDRKSLESILSEVEVAPVPPVDTTREAGAERPQALAPLEVAGVTVIAPSRPLDEHRDGSYGQRELRLPQWPKYRLAFLAGFEFVR